MALITITAGCLGGPGTGGVDSTPTETATSTAAPGGDGGSGDGGDFVGPAEALRNAGSFTSTLTLRVNDGTTTTETTELVSAVDLVNERSHERLTSGSAYCRSPIPVR